MLEAVCREWGLGPRHLESWRGTQVQSKGQGPGNGLRPRGQHSRGVLNISSLLHFRFCRLGVFGLIRIWNALPERLV